MRKVAEPDWWSSRAVSWKPFGHFFVPLPLIIAYHRNYVLVEPISPFLADGLWNLEKVEMNAFTLAFFL